MCFMLINLPYNLAQSAITVEVPDKNLLTILTPKRVRGNGALIETERALNSRRFKSLAKRVKREGGRVAILVDDHTRPTPIKVVLPKILERLNGAEVVVVYAKGTHEAPPEHFIEEKLGSRVLKSCEVLIHDAYDPNAHVFLGITRFGTPVWVNKRVAEANFKIGVGSIFPSEVAGFTGGCKIVLPGVTSWETTNRNHLLFLSPSVGVGRLEGNVLREDIDEAGLMAGLNLIIDMVLNPDNGVVKAFVGHPVAAHREGAQLCREIYRKYIPRRGDVVVVLSLIHI